MGNIVPFSDVTLGGVGAWRFKFLTMDVNTGDATFQALDATGDTVMATGAVNMGTGAGTMQLQGDISTNEVELVSQHFVAGDIIRRPFMDAITYVTFGMSDNDAFVYVDPDLTTGFPSSDYIRVGHVDPATLEA